MRVGYARVSHEEQHLGHQVELLEKDGCEKVFTDKKSGRKTSNRPGYNEMMRFIREGDTVVVWRLARLARSVKDLILVVEDFKQRNIGLVSLSEQIDTTTAAGKMLFHMFAAFAEFESDLISERTKAGLRAAKRRGLKGGRPRGLSAKNRAKAIAAKAMFDEAQLTNAYTVPQICSQLGIGKTTMYRYIRIIKEEEKAA